MLLVDELLRQKCYFGRNMHKYALFLLKNCLVLGALLLTTPCIWRAKTNFTLRLLMVSEAPFLEPPFEYSWIQRYWS